MKFCYGWNETIQITDTKRRQKISSKFCFFASIHLHARPIVPDSFRMILDGKFPIILRAAQVSVKWLPPLCRDKDVAHTLHSNDNAVLHADVNQRLRSQRQIYSEMESKNMCRVMISASLWTGTTLESNRRRCSFKM